MTIKVLMIASMICFSTLVHSAPAYRAAKSPLAMKTITAEMDFFRRTFFSNEKCEIFTRDRDVAKVRRWEQRHGDGSWPKLNRSGPSGNTILHRSIARGDIEFSQLLMSKGADPSQKNSEGISPYELAIQLNIWKTFPFHVKEQFDKIRFQQWLNETISPEERAQLINESQNGDTMLNRSIARKDIKFSELLIKHGAHPSQNDFSLAVQIKLWKKFSPFAQEQFDKARFEQLRGKLTASLMELYYSNFNKTIFPRPPKFINEIQNEKSMLHRSIARGDIEFSELLIREGADPLQKNSEGISPYELAVQLGHWENFPVSLKEQINQRRVDDLIKKKASEKLLKVLAEPLDKEGNTLLHRSISKRNIFGTESLIKHGADPLQKNSEGISPYELAIQLGYWKEFRNSVKIMIDSAQIKQWKKTPKELAEVLNRSLDEEGNTLLHFYLSAPIEDMSLIEQLIFHGADVRQHNTKNVSPLGLILRKELWSSFPISLKKAIYSAIQYIHVPSDFGFPIEALSDEEVLNTVKFWIRDESLISSKYKANLVRQIRNPSFHSCIVNYAEMNASDKVFFTLLTWNFKKTDFNLQLVGNALDNSSGLSTQIRNQLNLAIDEKLSYQQIGELSLLMDEIAQYVATADDCDLLRRFIEKTPFLKDLDKEQLREINSKIEKVEQLIYLPKILRSYVSENPEDQKLRETYEYLMQFTAHFIKLKSHSLKPNQSLQENRECTICYSKPEENMIDLKCGHSFHPTCLARGISYYLAHEQKDELVSCKGKNCTHSFSPIELASVVSNPEDVIKIQRLFIRSLGKYRFCPSCGDGIAQQNNFLQFAFQCQKCKKDLCFACGKPPHHGFTCKEINTDEAVKKAFMKELIQNCTDDEYGRCPHCGIITEKIDGCDTMTCGKDTHEEDPTEGKGCGKTYLWSERIKIEEEPFQEELPCLFEGCLYTTQSEMDLNQHIADRHPENTYDDSEWPQDTDSSYDDFYWNRNPF